MKILLILFLFQWPDTSTCCHNHYLAYTHNEYVKKKLFFYPELQQYQYYCELSCQAWWELYLMKSFKENDVLVAEEYHRNELIRLIGLHNYFFQIMPEPFPFLEFKCLH